MVNGLIFYSNIVWTYNETIHYRPEAYNNPMLGFLKVFIAWVNLDFGVETCFAKGLTAFWKTWLQFIFPLYIFSIAGLIILAARYSSRLTKLLGNRAVPLLATLFLLSYMKLLRTAVSSLEFSILTYSKYPNGSSSHAVWSIDGNLSYFHFPHILLFLVGLATLLFLWLPYTLLLLYTDAVAAASTFSSVPEMDYASTSPVRCILCPSQTQAPVLVWSAPAHSWNSTRDIYVCLCHPSKY